MNKLLMIIPARSGSTRVKNKNMRTLNGLPLVVHKIKACLNAKIGDVIVSTDSKKIAKFSWNLGAKVPILRTKYYSSAKATMMSCVLHSLRNYLESSKKLPDYVAVLPPTDPFLKYKTIKKIYKKILHNKKFNSICTYKASSEHPFLYINNKKKLTLNLIKYKNKKLTDFERSQDFPKAFIISNAMQISKIEYFTKYIKNKSSNIKNFDFDINSCIGYKISSREAFDINTETDLRIAKLMAKENNLIY